MMLWCVGMALAETPERVVILQWGGTDTTYTNEALQRNVRNRLARPGARFFPDADVYNPGRLEHDRTLSATELRPSPSREDLEEVGAVVKELAETPFDALAEPEWLLRADELRTLVDTELWFVDRAELREPTFLAYAQLGRAAENSNLDTPPYYVSIDHKNVNYYWYLAGVLAHEEPALLSKLSDEQLRLNINNYKDRIDAGEFKPLTLSFDLNREFDGRAFAGEYELYINGLRQDIVSPEGLYEVPLGTIDVHLQRIDGGHGLSVRFERQTADKGFEFPRQDAQKRMGLDLIDQLMNTPSKCIPEIDPDIAGYLSLYAKLHPGSTVYLAVPQFGSTSAKRLHMWRWNDAEAQLELVSRKGDPACTEAP